MVYPNDSNGFGLKTPEVEQGLEHRSATANVSGANMDEAIIEALTSPERPLTSGQKELIKNTLGIPSVIEGENNTVFIGNPTSANCAPVAYLELPKTGLYRVYFGVRYRKSSNTVSNISGYLTNSASIASAQSAYSGVTSQIYKVVQYNNVANTSDYYTISGCLVVNVTNKYLNFYIGGESVALNVSRLGTNAYLYAEEL